MNRPNILFIFSDQQRWDTCGCYGQPLDVTPNLDRMAARACASSRPSPASRSAGRRAPACKRASIPPKSAATPTIACCRWTRRPSPITSPHGYEVGYIGKWHLASTGPIDGPDDFRVKPVPPERRGGYDDYWLASDMLEFTSHSYDGHMFDGDSNSATFPEGRYRVDAQTDWVLEYLQTRTGEKPFFLFVSYIEPHHQNDHNHYEGPHGSRERFKDFVAPGDLAGAEGDWREEFPDYLGCIHSLDENLGRIRAELERLGLADNTLIIYTSDHGSHFRTRNAEYKRSCHDGCIRIPLVACGPGFSGGRVIGDLVSLIDLPPTVLAAAGIAPPQTMRGHALQSLIDGTRRIGRRRSSCKSARASAGAPSARNAGSTASARRTRPGRTPPVTSTWRTSSTTWRTIPTSAITWWIHPPTPKSAGNWPLASHAEWLRQAKLRRLFSR